MINQAIISSTAQGVKDCQAKLEKLRLLLATAKVQAHEQGDFEYVGNTLFLAECKAAQVQGILNAISGWLSPVEEQ